MPVDPMDPTNLVTALCIEGMNAQGLGEPETARQLFERAWQSRTTSLEAAVALTTSHGTRPRQRTR